MSCLKRKSEENVIQTAQGISYTNNGHFAVARIVGVEDNYHEIGVRFARRNMDPVARQEIFVGPSRYRMSFTTALVPQLQLWHLN